MLAHYQPQTVMLQSPNATTTATLSSSANSGSVPVIVEVQRLCDNARFKYNINVQPPALAASATTMNQSQQLPIMALGSTFPESPGNSNSSLTIDTTSNMMVTQQSMTHVVQTNYYPDAANNYYDHQAQPSSYMSALSTSSSPSSTMALVPYTPNVAQNQTASLSSSFQSNVPVQPAATTCIRESPMVGAYPPELQNLFRWNFCDLCKIAMRTARSAIDHYGSRAHDRKVSMWLMRNVNDRNTLPKDGLPYPRSTGPNAFYCDLCDLKLTSTIHANQHFFGRRHRMVARNICKPNGSGFYDLHGKWVRTNSKWLICPLCGVNITSESQMAMHLAGSKHQKKLHSSFNTQNLRINGSYMYSFTPEGTLYPMNPHGKYIHRVNLNGNYRKLMDLNALYYCEICEVSLNHLKSVKQHEDGKLHRKKLEKLKFFFRLTS